MKFSILILFTLILFTIYYLLFTIPVLATCHTSPLSNNIDVQNGLISTPQITNTKYKSNTGTCIFDTRASFAPFKVPTYADLKSLYFDQTRANKVTITPPSGDTTQASIDNTNQDTVYLINGNLTVSCATPPCNPPTTKTAVVFVSGNLNINNNYTYGSATTGTVFVVGRNVNILQDVTRIDAFIISEGTICTASESGNCPGGYTTPLPTIQALVVNGGLISLNDTINIRFRRTLSDNSLPAEKINNRPKYLVILKAILSSKVQKWSEIVGPFVIPSPAPSPIPRPTPTPSPSPSPTPTLFPCPSGLLVNGCFENQLANWDCLGASSGSCSADSIIRHTGLYSGKVTDIGGGWGWQLSQNRVSASTSETFCLQAWVKKQNAFDSVAVFLQLAQSPWSQNHSLPLSNTTDWQLARGSQSASWGAGPVQIVLRVGSISSAWFDDVSLTRDSCI